MAFTIGALKVHFILQEIVPLPYFIEPLTLAIYKNPYRLVKTRRICYKLCVGSMFFHLYFSFVWLLWIQIGRPGNLRDLNETFIYLIIFSLCAIATSAYFTLEKYQNHIEYQLTQRFKLIKPLESDYSLKSLIIITFSAIFLAFPVLTSFFPYAMDIDPVQIVCLGLASKINPQLSSDLYFNYSVKIIASFVYCATTCYGAGICLGILLFAIMDLEGMEKLSNRMIGYGNHERFNSCLSRFRIVRIFIGKTNYIMQEFLGILVMMGIFLAVSCGFGTLKMYGILPTVTYFACPFIHLVCYSYNFIHVTLAAVTNRNGQKFVMVWKRKVVKKSEGKDLAGCARIGYAIGPITCVKHCTAFSIADTILSWTVSAAMIQRNNV
ncbi:unnamed protein product [Orchesella dallaii]|uniref:Odorant receptor n=1 Tax=Orchesella dallaii TaxID=48710 RepID=A0ABP1RQJ9_9HEXA